MIAPLLTAYAVVFGLFGVSSPGVQAPIKTSQEPSKTAKLATVPKGKSQQLTRRRSTSQAVNPAKIRSGDPDWQRAEKEIYANQKELNERIDGIKRSEVNKLVLRSGSPNRHDIALTFDDGPHPDYTLKLLEILRTEHVSATFFVVGFMADKYPELVRSIRAAGHEVGNHTYSHVTLNKIPINDVMTEYKANNDVIFRLTGKRARYCRPPGGDFNRDVLKASATLGLTTVLWTDDPGDYIPRGGTRLLKRTFARLDPGGIILLHDGSQDTLDILSQFIRSAKQKGYRFVTLDELKG